MDARGQELAAAFERLKPRATAKEARRKQLMKAFLVEHFGDRETRILDIGGGKFPLFGLDELPASWSYVVNDISERELSRLPGRYETIHADICGDLSAHHGSFDVLFSCMLAEHLKDGEAFYRNQFQLLRPGGVLLHLHPTLYSPPFVLNRYLPFPIARTIIYTLSPERKANDSVFPAYYDWCTARESELERRRALGFAHIDVALGYHHGYLRHIPLLSQLSDASCSLFQAMDARIMASYALYFGIR